MGPHLHHNKNTEMKKIFTSLLALVALSVSAQVVVSDSVLTMGGASDVYYDLSSQTQTPVSRTTWDIGLTTDGRGASVIINENAGVELYLYSTDTSDWSSIDTNGFAFDNIYNSETTWNAGAFANQGTTHPDYGWGMYDMNSHDINGNRLFIVKTKDGDYLKVVIDKMSAAGLYTFRTAKLDGSDLESYSYSKTQAESKDKNFALLNLTSGDFVYTNPNTKDWDILFTKYITFVQAGPNSRYQPVGGVKINAGCEVAQRDNVSPTDNDTSSLTWTTDITEIGWDWKTFDLQTSSYSMVAGRTYFVRTANGSVHKIWFTDYSVGTAIYKFNTEALLLGTDKITKLNTTVYPNPTAASLTIDNKEKEALTYTLLNTQGVTVYTGTVGAFTSNSISTNDFANGVYFLQLSTSSITNTQRVIFE
jgi:hypothetical protein